MSTSPFQGRHRFSRIRSSVLVVVITVAVIAIPIAIVVPPVLHAIPPDVISAPAVLAFFIQRMTAAARLRAVLTVFADGPIQPGFGFLDAMLTLFPFICLRAGRTDQNEGGTEKGCAYDSTRTKTHCTLDPVVLYLHCSHLRE